MGPVMVVTFEILCTSCFGCTLVVQRGQRKGQLVKWNWLSTRADRGENKAYIYFAGARPSTRLGMLNGLTSF